MTVHITEPVSYHYSRDDLAESILTALRAAGKNIESLSLDDLALVDQFHIQGKESTLELARFANVNADMEVVDVGGGLGGPARTLAREFGCHVTVLDVTKSYCQVGEMLTELTGLNDRVNFRNGSALEMPFSGESFDLVWTQHSSMNISDKERLYSEIYRVLRPQGRLAIHEIMAGQVTPIYLPVPWAREAGISHLRKPEEVQRMIINSGFRDIAWFDKTESAVEWFEHRLAAMEEVKDKPHVGLHLLLGDDFNEMFKNMLRNLKESRITVIQAMLERA